MFRPFQGQHRLGSDSYPFSRTEPLPIYLAEGRHKFHVFMNGKEIAYTDTEIYGDNELVVWQEGITAQTRCKFYEGGW